VVIAVPCRGARGICGARVLRVVPVAVLGPGPVQGGERGCRAGAGSGAGRSRSARPRRL